MFDLLITACDVLVRDSEGRHTIINDRDIAIKGNRIAAITRMEDIDHEAAGEVIDGTGMLAIPGLINTHTHAPMVLFRGLAEDLVLMEWLQKYIFPAEAKNVDEDFVRVGTR